MNLPLAHFEGSVALSGPEPKRLAIIEIGSRAARLMVADIQHGAEERVLIGRSHEIQLMRSLSLGPNAVLERLRLEPDPKDHCTRMSCMILEIPKHRRVIRNVDRGTSKDLCTERRTLSQRHDG